MEKRCTILGAGESGVWAAVLASLKGWNAFVSDSKNITAEYKAILNQYKIDFEEGEHSLDKICDSELIIKSPGVPESTKIVQTIRKQKIELISEIEWAFRYTDKPVIAITGTNGKSTTTRLIGHILDKASLKVSVGGNLGDAFSKLVINAEEDTDYYVLEVSSFQLDDCKTFKPKISIILNITEDHLDRYQDKFENYIQSKLSIARLMDKEDTLILNFDDKVLLEHINKKQLNTRKLWFGMEEKKELTAFTRNNKLIIAEENPFEMELTDLKIKGKHNIYNSMAAGISARVLDLRKEVIRESFMDFKGLEHRLEFVARIGGVEYINDSKATNVNSAWYALESMNKPTVWIAGGVDKGNDYASIIPLIRKKVKAIICLGANNVPLHNAFSKHVDVMMNTDNMREAVEMAAAISTNGDAVLLSPACASFDLFENYKKRGEHFKKHVIEL
ncbi:MAG: UDP-N-acetylmuramoyl-L-alanine--D-glutamate ligase [Chitinophagaceae bacterium]|nr:MAG: UDP-N-acetylmuramoyl-L-alanine--D-glutamate ligase [Chitinophagaceae bacterium]